MYRRLALEALIVAIAGLLFGLAANQLSPRGLSLTRDYFPRIADRSSGTPSLQPTSPGTSPPDRETPGDTLDVPSQLEGWTLTTYEELTRLHGDPAFLEERFVFIDARPKADYSSGHIPGAHQFDHYRPEESLDEVLPVCLAADLIVVYCNGGDCEDSQFAATDLIQMGVEPERVRIFPGGMEDWRERGGTVEKGARFSGEFETIEQ